MCFHGRERLCLEQPCFGPRCTTFAALHMKLIYYTAIDYMTLKFATGYGNDIDNRIKYGYGDD